MSNAVIEFVVIGEPKPQPRPATRVMRRKGGGEAFAHIYTPSRIEPWKKLVTLYATRHVPIAPFRGPVRMEITAGLPREKQMQKPGWPAEELHADNHSSGDVDNYAKPIMDVLTNMQFWADDAQVVSLTCRKFYVRANEEPSAWVRIECLQGAEDAALSADLLLAATPRRKKKKAGKGGQLEIIPPRDYRTPGR